MKKSVLILCMAVSILLIACNGKNEDKSNNEGSELQDELSEETTEVEINKASDTEVPLYESSEEVIWLEEDIESAEKKALEYYENIDMEVEFEHPLELTPKDHWVYEYWNKEEDKYIIFDTVGKKDGERVPMCIVLEKIEGNWSVTAEGYY